MRGLSFGAYASSPQGGGNNAPTITVPSAQTMEWNSVFTFDPGEGNGLYIVDDDNDVLHVTLSVSHGTLTLADASGLTNLTGDGTSSIEFDGTPDNAAINPAINGMTYEPNADYAGIDALNIAVDDGHGGTDSDSVTINVQCVRTLVLGTSADFYYGYGQQFKLGFDVEGGGESGVIVIQSTPSDTAAQVAVQLAFLNPVVYGSWDGSDQNIVIVFDASVGVVDLSYVDAQWYPTITLDEDVTQQGVADVAGVKEQFTVTCTSAPSSIEQVALFDGTYYVEFDTDGNHLGESLPGAWSLISGGGSSSPLYEYSTEQTVTDANYYGQNGDGSYSVTTTQQGVTAVTGQPEIHTITPTPRTPTGGTWKPISSEGAISYDGSTSYIQAKIDASILSGMVTITGGNVAGIAQEPVTATWNSNGEASDTILSPVNVDLTAPEMAHSIT